jgi:hypothetical protein
MSVQKMRFGMGVLFLLLAGVIFARAWIVPDLDRRFDSLRMNLGGVLALVFAGLNFARWYAVWSYRRTRATPVRTPLQADPSAVRPEPPNPELDFTKPDEKGEPGA